MNASETRRVSPPDGKRMPLLTRYLSGQESLEDESYTVDDLRCELTSLLERKGSALKIIGCPGNCFQHADAHVVYCYDRYVPLIHEEIEAMRKEATNVDFEAINYQDPAELQMLPPPILHRMPSRITSEELPKGLSSVKSFGRGAEWAAEYVAANLPEGMYWDPEEEDFKAGAAKPAKKKRRGRKPKTPVIVEEEEVEKVVSKPRRKAAPIAPQDVDMGGGVGADDIAEILGQIDAVRGEVSSTQEGVDVTKGLVAELINKAELTEQALLVMIRLNYALLTNALGNNDALGATTLEEAVEELGE